MPSELYALLWSDDEGAQCALYEDEEQALADAQLVGGRVERRAVHAALLPRAGRFTR